MPDTVPVIVGAVLTIAVLSYLIGDNFVYRLAMHVLVGVGAAYALGVAVDQVLMPGLIEPLRSQAIEGRGLAFGLFSLLGLVLLLAKAFRRAAWMGNVAVGYMLGVGVGVAIGGALLGALVPQTVAAAESLNAPGGIVSGLLLIVSTLATLLAFAYSRASGRSFLGAVGTLGRGFLYVAFGATFALVFVASASVLSGWVRDMFVWLFPGG